MQQVEEVLLPPSVNLNGPVLKLEVMDQPLPTSAVSTDLTVAPPSSTHVQLIAVPITKSRPLLTNTSSATIKRIKRGFRTSLSSKKVNRSSAKPATLLARPSIGKASTILPHPQKPVVLSNQIAPIIPKSIPSIPTNQSQGFTTYLVVDGNQGQLVQVASDGQKPVTFHNQAGQVLQATPITVVSAGNQPAVPSYPVNGDCSLLSNSSQTVTTIRTSSSIDMQQQTTITSDTTQKLTGMMHQPSSMVPTSIFNGNNLQTYNNGSSLDGSRTSDANLSLSLAQIAHKASHRHRRSSSSSTSKKKRGRPRLYERDPFTNKPIKSGLTSENTELTTTTTFNTLPSHSNGYGSIIFPNQTTTIPATNPSLLQQHQYQYPSLFNGNTSSTNMFVSPTFNTFTNNTNTTLSSTTFPYSSQSTRATEFSHPSRSSISSTSGQNLQVSSSSTPTTSSPRSTNVPNFVQLNTSPIKSLNNDIAVHYIGGFVIRESSQPFLSHENLNQQEKVDLPVGQIQCVVCKTIGFSQRFFDKERQYCSKSCLIRSYGTEIPYEQTPPPIAEPIRFIDKIIPQQPVESTIDEQIPLPPDHGLPADPSKWTVSQVGEFIARLTNETIREAFYESEMDGQALLLMTHEHLRDTMKIKLGPALIISSEITKLSARAKTFSS